VNNTGFLSTNQLDYTGAPC